MKKEPLHVKYRPKTWDDVAGKRNKKTVKKLKAVLKRGGVRAFLLSGPPGCGKTSIAGLIAKEVGCHDSEYYKLNAANNRGIDTIREIIKRSDYFPLAGPCKVFLLDEAHGLTDEASEALLKITEEPPEGVYFILATTNPEDLIVTLRDRCSPFQVFPLDHSEIKDLLLKVMKEEGIDGVTEKVLEEIVSVAKGSPRLAFRALDQIRDLKDEKEMLDAIATISIDKEAVMDPAQAPMGKESRVSGLTLQDIAKLGELTYLIDEILPESCLVILAGREGVGKSLVALEIIKALLIAPGPDPNIFLDPQVPDENLQFKVKLLREQREKKEAQDRIGDQGHPPFDQSKFLNLYDKSDKTQPENKPTDNGPPGNKLDKPDELEDEYNELVDDNSSNRLFRKYQVVRGGPVLSIDQENPGALLGDRLKKMWGQNKRTDKFVGQEHRFECLHHTGIRVDNKTSFKQLKEKIHEFKPILLVIDSLSTIHHGSEVSSQKMAVVIEKLRELLNEGKGWGLSILVIHHHSKAGSIRGSTAIPAGCDIEYSLKEDKDGHLILKTEKTRVKGFGPVRLKLDTSYDSLRILYDGAVSDDIFEALKKVLQDNGWVDYKTISEKLLTTVPSLKAGRLRYTLKKLADERKIEEDSIRNPRGGKPILKYKLAWSF